MPTVVVARTVRPSREREFERWIRRLLAEAEGAPGYVAAEVRAPTELRPHEWVVVYQFEDSDTLARWLASPERAAMLERGRDLIVGEPREQVVAMAREGDSVTAVASARVRPESRHAYRALHDRMMDAVSRAPGFVRAQLYEPVEGIQDDTVVVFTFDDREHLERWLRSDERAELVASMEPHIEGHRTVNVVGGFAGWFTLGASQDVKRWKQASVVLLALFPTTLLLTVVRQGVLPDLPLVPAVLVGNVAGVAILSWLLMPWLTHLLGGWLRK